MPDDDIEKLKEKLKSYSKQDVEFNEPHFTYQLEAREGNRKEVMENLLNPEKLVYSYQETGKHGDIVHCLHFRISSTRTIRLPVIFDRNGKKSLYIITYVMRYRTWQSRVRKRQK